MTITLTPEQEAAICERATRFNMEPQEYVGQLIKIAMKITEPTGFVPPVRLPAWVAELKPQNPPTDGTNGLHRAIGAWPGDETEEELLAAEKRLDDEDAGRISHQSLPRRMKG